MLYMGEGSYLLQRHCCQSKVPWAWVSGLKSQRTYTQSTTLFDRQYPFQDLEGSAHAYSRQYAEKSHREPSRPYSVSGKALQEGGGQI